MNAHVIEISIMFMSGLYDGEVKVFSSQDPHDGIYDEHKRWILRIGRKTDGNDLVIEQDATISRTHACLTYHDGQWYLQDNGSRNGTFLDSATLLEGQQVKETPVPIQVGELFKIGRTWLRIQAES